MKYFLVLIILIVLHSDSAHAQWYNQFTEDCVILIEKNVNEKYYPIGTGFLIQSETASKYPIVVTNKHILSLKKIYISIPADKEIIDYVKWKNISEIKMGDRIWKIQDKRLRTEYNTIKDGKLNYILHEDTLIDIAAFPLEIRRFISTNDDFNGLAKKQLPSARGKIKCCSFTMVPRKFIGRREDMRLGRDTFFLGFPLGFGAEDPISPILRSGTIAWVDPEGKEFWLDAVSLNGNSGSPVFAKPNTEDNLDEQHSRLIGMIYAHWGQNISLYVPDENNKVPVEAIKEIENLGLARAVWADDILNVVERAERLMPLEDTKSTLLPPDPEE